MSDESVSGSKGSAVGVDEAEIGRSTPFQGELLDHHLPRRVGIALDVTPEQVELVEEILPAAKLATASAIPIRHRRHGLKLHVFGIVLRVLPATTFIPGKQGHVHGQHLLGGNALRLVPAEKDHRPAAPPEIKKIALAIRA